MRIKSVMLILCLSILFNLSSHAKFKGPDETPHYATISDVLAHPVDEEKVKLDGHIEKKIGYNMYLFRDRTGEVPVIISDIMITLHKDFSPNDLITIYAKINIRPSGSPELIASSFDIA